MQTLPVMVSYNIHSNWEWTRQAVLGFQKFLPSKPLLVVDHNHNNEEIKFLKSKNIIVVESQNRRERHGDGIDLAVEWAKSHNYDILVHFEPDCLITGRSWYDNLVQAIESGYWMAGTYRFPTGFIHPCPSAWLISEIKYSFAEQLKGDDVNRKEYKLLIDDSKQNLGHDFHLKTWDCGLKNWFECEAKNKAIVVDGHSCFHYYYGSSQSPFERGLVIQDNIKLL